MQCAKQIRSKASVLPVYLSYTEVRIPPSTYSKPTTCCLTSLPVLGGIGVYRGRPIQVPDRRVPARGRAYRDRAGRHDREVRPTAAVRVFSSPSAAVAIRRRVRRHIHLSKELVLGRDVLLFPVFLKAEESSKGETSK